MVKRWLDDHGIAYESLNINQDEQAANYVLRVKRGMRSVPTIVFPDSSILVEPSMRQLAAKGAAAGLRPAKTAMHDPSSPSVGEVLLPYQPRKQGHTMNATTRLLIIGAIAGMVAGALMAMYAMIASATFLGQGFFTPL